MPTRLRNAFATARLAGPLRTLCLPSRFRTRGAAYLSTRTLAPLVVVGSMNADVILEIDRFPQPGETITTPSPDTGRVVAGGKGANQAVAAARLSAGTGRRVRFVGQFGNDAHARMLESVLKAEGVDVGLCGRATDKPSGQGYVFLEADGAVSSIVVGGANAMWPAEDEGGAWYADLVRGAGVLLLQREVPEHVNAALAAAAAAAGVPVMQDMGGEDRPIADALLPLITYLTLNETELDRLTQMPTATEQEVVAAARSLRGRGAHNVLVTLGAAGALLVTEDGQVLRAPACAIPGGVVVDATGAGDAFRAAFAVALVEGRELEDCLKFAAAAGATAVAKLGAVPSLPSRGECERAEAGRGGAASVVVESPTETPATASGVDTEDAGPCPMKFASRLNSMKDRPDLWDGGTDVMGMVARQGTIQGLDLVDFNYPQHLDKCGVAEVRTALSDAGLGAGAICMRYPKAFRLGAFTNPDPQLRREAVELTLEAAQWARDLGADELVMWSAYDGYDYALQVDYRQIWDRTVAGFQEVCDAFPDLKVSLEYKPTDENTRFFAVPSTGASLWLLRDVNRPNMGLTLDIGHCLMAGENPAQSVAMVGTHGKLFGVQLNDGYGRLGAEDGLMFGSVNPRMALEFVLWLQRTRYAGHVYFDTFPRNEDPVREAEYNIRQFKALWERARGLSAAGLEGYWARHDAIGVLELLESGPAL